jgi:hypothetical protein
MLENGSEEHEISADPCTVLNEDDLAMPNPPGEQTVRAHWAHMIEHEVEDQVVRQCLEILMNDGEVLKFDVI